MDESSLFKSSDWSFLLPTCQPHSRLGQKLSNLLLLKPDFVQLLFSKQLLKIAHNNSWPHCPTCKCNGEHRQLPELSFTEDDVINLRVINFQCEPGVNRALVARNSVVQKQQSESNPDRVVKYRSEYSPPKVPDTRAEQSTSAGGSNYHKNPPSFAASCSKFCEPDICAGGSKYRQSRSKSPRRDRRARPRSPSRDRRARSRSHSRDRRDRRARSRTRDRSDSRDRKARSRDRSRRRSGSRRNNRFRSLSFAERSNAQPLRKLPVIGKWTKSTWPPRKEDTQAYKQINANLTRLAHKEEIHIDGPRVSRFTSTSVSYQVEQTSVKLSQLSLPRGIIAGTDDVRIIPPSIPPRGPVVNSTPRKRQFLEKPIPLQLENPFYQEEVVYLETGGEYGDVVDSLDLYEEQVGEVPTTLAANSEVEIEENEVEEIDPEGDIESDSGLYSDGDEGTQNAEQLLASCQPLLGNCLPLDLLDNCQSPVRVSIPESGAPLPLGLPAAISPLAPDSETERLKTLRLLRESKPQGYGYANNNNFLK
jgi:hypothetical protein